jgi:hypothetical protein
METNQITPNIQRAAFIWLDHSEQAGSHQDANREHEAVDDFTRQGDDEEHYGP